MSPEEIALLVRAAQRAGIDPSKLQAANPWQFEGQVAMTLQSAVRELDPDAAERFQQQAGVKLSLGAEAALAGLQEWSTELEQELAIKAPGTYQRLTTEAQEEAVEKAFGAFNARREEARKLAESYRWNVNALAQLGHHLAATVAAEHLEQQAQQGRQEQQAEQEYMRRMARNF
jgi:hypothetical protein